jgi:hypothetical protein
MRKWRMSPAIVRTDRMALVRSEARAVMTFIQQFEQDNGANPIRQAVQGFS